MNPNFAGLVAIGFGIAAFATAYAFLRPRPIATRIAAFLLLTLLSIPALLVSIYYLHVLPEWEWFYTLRSRTGSEFLVVLPGAAAGCFATMLPRFFLVLPLSGFLAIAIVPYLKPFVAPLHDSELRDQWAGDACQQSTLSTCGPATVCTILKALGEPASERDVAHAAFTYAGGTEAWYLARYLRGRGFAPHFEFRDTFAPDAGLPAMVGVRMGGMGHFIAVLAVSGDGVTFADPMGRGVEHLPMSDFLRTYHFTGFHMTVPPRTSS
ncbi:MAG: cysteine peptidase family C39 domain-containing protein [Chthoniobacterales bacterium]